MSNRFKQLANRFVPIFLLILGVYITTENKIYGQSVESVLSKEQFLDTLSKKTFSYFWELAGKQNGQVPDRWPNQTFSSIAAYL